LKWISSGRLQSRPQENDKEQRNASNDSQHGAPDSLERKIDFLTLSALSLPRILGTTTLEVKPLGHSNRTGVRMAEFTQADILLIRWKQS
jgi:hypothetical protein